MKQLVIGIFAHVDAGKTTLSEALLYCTGQLRRLGRVDHRDAFLDTDALERERGITIFAKQAVLEAGGVRAVLLDTPGHVDFAGEAERTLDVLDCAVLVLDGTAGVQSHTETLWQLLEQKNVPVFVFVNKMDLAGADKAAALADLRRLSPDCVDFTAGPDALAEELAARDEALLASYLDGGAVTDEAAAALIAQRRVFPCWFGAALRLDGVPALWDGLCRYTRAPQYPETFGARVFKISRDAQGARLTHIKVTGGTLRVKALLEGAGRTGQPWREKADALRVYSGAKFTAVDEVAAGGVCAVTGLSVTWAGEGLGCEPDAAPPVLQPVLRYRVRLPEGCDAHGALEKLRALEEEDPQLHVTWDAQLGEIRLDLMGEVQLEVLQRVIAARFGLAVTFDEGGVAYRETIADTVEGIGHFEPLRHYAEVHLVLAPGAPGSGLRFGSVCPADRLDASWQNLILTHLAEKEHRGVLTGSPLTDVVITLAAGKAHLKHTEGGDFREATYRAVRQGLMQAQSVLLEPWFSFRLSLPAASLGRAMADVQRMGGSFEPAAAHGDSALLTGRAPAAAMRGYAAEVAAYTRGAGRLSCAPAGYLPCQNAQAVIEAIGYDPARDAENPAGSVFCSHGAGHPVPWDEVAAHAHIPPVLAARAGEPPANEAPAAPKRAAPTDSLAEDKELAAIFERTYGPVRRREVFRNAPDAPVEARWRDAGPEYLLVDGYNIIFAWDELKELARTSLDAARAALADILCNFQGFRRCTVILVFDAYKVKNNPGSVVRYHNIHIVYTKEAETADMYIEKATFELAKTRRVRVATSDGMEQMIILGHGALRMSAQMLKAEVELANTRIREIIRENNRKNERFTKR